jgi:hypothetical protein
VAGVFRAIRVEGTGGPECWLPLECAGRISPDRLAGPLLGSAGSGWRAAWPAGAGLGRSRAGRCPALSRAGDAQCREPGEVDGGGEQGEVSGDLTAVPVMISESGSAATWPLYPSNPRAEVLCPCRASGSTTEITRPGATRRAIVNAPPGSGSSSRRAPPPRSHHHGAAPSAAPRPAHRHTPAALAGSPTGPAQREALPVQDPVHRIRRHPLLAERNRAARQARPPEPGPAS